jgi:glucosamine--fructose-6-phosphate aminotransferase (isomerizing)
MLDEIRQQPDVVRDIVGSQRDLVRGLSDAIVKRDIRFAYVAARGTSDNVAHYAKYVFEIEHGIPIALAAPSVFTIYDAVPHLDDRAFVLGISQSGSAPDVIAVVDRARRTGALTAAITNCAGSPLATTAEFCLVTPAGEELSIAATKTYTSALAMVALLSACLSADRSGRVDELHRAADVMDRTLYLEDAIRHWVGRYKTMTDCVVLGRGFNHCTALEIALKLTETCYVGAKAFSGADFLHGPVAQVHEGFPILLIAPDGKAYQSMYELIGSLRRRNPDMIAFAGNPDFLSGAETAIRVPGPVSEWLSPLVYAVAGQLFAHALSVVADHDPDRPRGLSKVTKTT